MGNISRMVLGIILFATIIGGGALLITLFDIKHYVEPSSYQDFVAVNNTMNKIYGPGSLNESVGKLQGSLASASSDTTGLGMLNMLILTAWNGLQSIFATWGFFISMIYAAGNVMPVELKWMVGLGVMAIIVVVIFTIYSAFFQHEI